MAHTYVSELIHSVFSTKERRNLIAAEMQPRLWSFLGGIARKNGFKALMVGGTENHVHILLSLPATMPLAKAMQLIKGASSHWMNETFKTEFAWQEGYGAFTLGVSQKTETIAYIQNQAEHHRKRNYEEEFLAFLKKNGIEYDLQHVWGQVQASLRDAVPQGDLTPALKTPGYCHASSGRKHRSHHAAGQQFREFPTRGELRHNVRRTFDSSPAFQRWVRCRETEPRPLGTVDP